MDRSVIVRLRAEVAQFKSAMAESSAAVTGVGVAAQAAGAKATAAEQAKATAARVATREANLSTTATGRMVLSAEKNRQAWVTSGRAIAITGAIITAAVFGMTKAAVQWESDWAGVTKTVSGTPAQLSAVEEGLRGLARELPTTHTQIAAVAAAAGQLGVATPDVVGFTEVMVALGETTNMTAEEAATSIAQISNVMGTLDREGTEGISRLASTVVELGNNSATTERDIINMAQRIAAAGKLIGLSEADILSISAAMASVGINAESGGTAVSKVFQEMSKTVATGGEDLEAFARVADMSAQEFARAFTEDPAQAFNTFTQGLGRIKEEGGNVFAVLEELGFADIRVSNALLTMATSGDLLTDSLALGAAAWEENTALMAEAERRYATTESRLRVTKSAIQDVAISMGEGLLPVVAGAADAFSSFTAGIGRLPDPLLKTAGGLLAVAGPLALVAGGFLMTFPRILETTRALGDMNIISPRVTAGVGKMGGAFLKTAGYAGAFLVLAGVLGTIADKLIHDVVPGAEHLEAAIKSMSTSGTQNLSALDDQFSNFGSLLGVNRSSVMDLGSAMDDVFRDDAFRWMERAVGAIPGITEGFEQVEERFRSLDQQMATMVNSGNAEEVRESLDAIFALGEEKGYSVEQMNTLFSKTTDALFGVEDAAGGADGAMEGMVTRVNSLTGEVEELTEAEQELLDTMGEADASFIDFAGAMDAVIAKNKEVAQSTADATESAEDSWEDFYDGTSFAMDAWLTALEEQVQAQSDWEANMLLLSGRVSDGVLEELHRMGAEGAPLVAALVDGTGEELERMEVLFGESAPLAVESYAQGFADSIPVMRAAAAQLGVEAYEEMSRRLSEGEITLQQAIDEYDLTLEPIAVEADTAPAWFRINGFIVTVDKETGIIKIDGNPKLAISTVAQLLKDVGLSHEAITINGEPLNAEITLGQLLAFVKSSEEPISIAGDNTEGAGALRNLLVLVSRSEEWIDVDADTSEATSTTRRWQPPPKTGTVNYIPHMAGWTPPVKTGYINYISTATDFATGGYTGDGGKYEVAGEVHRGEWVTTKERTSQYLPILQDIHSGKYPKPYWSGGPVGFTLPGYAEGGQVAAATRGGGSGDSTTNTTVYNHIEMRVDARDLAGLRSLEEFMEESRRWERQRTGAGNR